MGINANNFDPASFLEAAERVAEKIGLGGAVVLIVAIGFAASIWFKGPEWLTAFGSIVKDILEFLNERKRINAIIESNKNALSTRIDEIISIISRGRE